ncbi:four-carbon acid sugar kinase family protein [Pendulispora albinea]|uniref:Four-carbon acid sugar kinase family protein n=1 Tax=Pendulispora albinea TaxID=2741071 RepID=A0ABZ2LLX1_9BACT
MMTLLADDLTSALDGAAPFAARGLSARVVLDPSGLGEPRADVVAIDLDSRFASPGEAEARFRGAAERLPDAAIVYKTIDSTLRGNLSAEIQGALRGSGRARAVVAPAFPAAGRTTVAGRQLLHGVPLEHTAFARDPRTPVETSIVAERLAGLERARFSVHDAERDRDLDALVAAIGLESDVVWVGSPGLAAALARAIPHREASRPAFEPANGERALVVLGSLHPANDSQVERLVRAGARMVELPSGEGDVDPAAIASQIVRGFASGPLVCLRSPRAVSERGRSEREHAARGHAAAAEMAERMGAVVRCCAEEFDSLVATGGDTARRIVDALGASALDLMGEVEPGVPFGVLRRPRRAIPFSTKAGGFGDAETLLRCVHRLHTHEDEPSP